MVNLFSGEFDFFTGNYLSSIHVCGSTSFLPLNFASGKFSSLVYLLPGCGATLALFQVTPCSSWASPPEWNGSVHGLCDAAALLPTLA